jgi:chromosome segregation ATPase
MIKKLSMPWKSDEPAETTVPEPAANARIEEASKDMDEDPLHAKLMDIAREMIASREDLKKQILERDKTIQEKENKIRELLHEREYLEKKLKNTANEAAKAQEALQEQKIQHEQQLNEFNVYRQQQEQKIRDLQERLAERELTNRQLILDLNRNQKEHELKLREMEAQERENQVQLQLLDKKYKQALSEKERLSAVIQEFTKQATLFSQFDRVPKSN